MTALGDGSEISITNIGKVNEVLVVPGVPGTQYIIDAKGDLIAGTAADTAARLAVGSNGGQLVADSTQSTGLRYTTALRLEGTGSPEGVVTAPVGSIFSDSAATTGAVVWVKYSGSGNTGWKVALGDTGWRNVTASLTGLDAGNTGTLKLKRLDGGRVVWAFNNLLLGAGTGSVLLWGSVPLGFRPTTQANAFSMGLANRNNSGTYQENIFLNGATIYWVSEVNLATGAGTTTRPAVGITGLVTTLTDDAWPSSLPGS